MRNLLRSLCLLAVLAGAASLPAASFTSAGPITFADTGVNRQCTPYPSTINVSGVPAGSITSVSVTFSNLTHPRPDDIEVLLVSPWGGKLVILADAGGASTPVSGITLTLDDAAGSLVPDAGPMVGGSFKPTCYDNLNNIATEFPGQTVADPGDTAATNGTATFTSVFGGSHNPNGTWSLYVVDDVSTTDAASFGSWTINITTSPTTVGTTTTLSAVPNPSFLGSNVTFTATVIKQTDATPVTSGTVTFREGGTILSANVPVNGSGVATFSTTALTEGDHAITADYNPSAGFLASNGSVGQRVNRTTARSGNTFCNTGGLTLSTASGMANVYPSHVFVTGLAGTISKVTLTVSNLTINRPDDLSLLLVGPNGAKFLALNDAGGTAAGVAGINLTLDDSAASLVPDTTAPVSGTYRPSSHDATVLPAPAPATPYNHPAPLGSSTFANVFNGINPNGTWSLYAYDDVTGEGATIAGGWCLTFTLTSDAPTTTTVASSVNPSVLGGSTTFTATVRKTSDNSLVTVGSVTFREGATVLAGPVALNGSGQAAFTTSALSEGQHTITADYGGSAGFYNISSANVTQTVDGVTLVSGTTFCNTGRIQIVTGQTPTVYPSRINVAGLPLNFCKLSVTVSNLFIDSPDDVELLLVSPGGAKFVLLSDAGGTGAGVGNVTLVFRDDAVSIIPDAGPMTSGIWRPTDVSSSPASFPAPAPAAPYAHPAPIGAATLAGTFGGGNPNGVWSLYAVDDVGGGQSLVISNGWCLTFNYPQVATAGGPQSICPGGTTAGLGGNAPLAGTGAWSIVGGGTGTFSPSASTPDATFTHTGGSGPITLRWTLTDPACGSSTADVVVTLLAPPAIPTITPSPTTVCGNSTENQASGPAGAAFYQWDIANGIITSPDNAQAIFYTAGPSGNVTLTLVVYNASGCARTNSLNVPIIAAPATPTITLNPSTVCAGLPGNLATGPAGVTSYAWTISNGTISGPANLQTVSYVAGGSGSVGLGLTVFNASGCRASNFASVPITPVPAFPPGCSFQTNYVASMTFTDAIPSVPTGLAFDGTNYWACSGGGASGVRLGRYDANGTLTGSFSPGLDFRSVFTGGGCDVLARAYNNRTIYRQVAPGVFTNSGVTLTGGTLDPQSSVVMNGARTEYIAMSGGVVSRWSLTGAYLGSVTLSGFGSVSGETAASQDRGVAAVGDYWLTYNAGRILSVWNSAGIRVTTGTLAGAGVNTVDSSYSFSYCNGKVWVVDNSGGLWRGYDVCAPARVAVFGAPGTPGWNTDVQNKILGAGTIAQVDAFMVSPGNPVPTLADLRKYQAVLVYSDTVFADNTALGNVLADYVDQGGGVVLATFAFWNSGGLSMQGRLVTGGYLPFTTAGQSSGANLTLVPDLPSHPILNGVTSFNGGSQSYHNSAITTANGAALVAHWSNGQPLVGAREAGPGRVVGLNFYPPSSDALANGWLASTDGGRLMANALMWAGKEPPAILSGPSNLLSVVGGTVNFNVAAVGTAPLQYQWRKNGTNLPGATTSNLSFTATLASAGQYSVAVSNAYGAAYSSNALLSVMAFTNLVLNATDTGWYDNSGAHGPNNPNYIVGALGSQSFRDWFIFSVPPLPGPIARAELRIYTYGIFTPTNMETFQLRQVTTSPATLQAGGSGLTAIYDDLGDGPTYSARAFVPAEANRHVSVTLNAAGKSAVAAAAGSQFALGGEVVTLDADTGNNEYLFGSSSGVPGDVQLVLTLGTGDVPTVGYFTDNSTGAIGPDAPITLAGFTPVHIFDIATQNLAGLRILVINENSNFGVSSALAARLPAIRSWVEAGGRLVIHDRAAGNITPNPFLLGTPGLGTVRLETSDLDLIAPATTLVTAGPFGILTNSSLDGGSSSAHGYFPAGSLPPGARAILSLGVNSNQVVCFSYPLGAGFIYYSSIPLDCYLSGGGCTGIVIAPALQNIYLPNVLTYIHALNPRLRFLPPSPPVGGAFPLFLGNLDNTPIHQDRIPGISLYTSSDIALPLGAWSWLPASLVPTNGLLRVDGINTNGGTPAFFRTVETP